MLALRSGTGVSPCGSNRQLAIGPTVCSVQVEDDIFHTEVKFNFRRTLDLIGQATASLGRV